MTIWKFPLRLEDSQEVVMPSGSQLLSAQEQHGVACIWALVEESGPKIRRRIDMHGTGHLLSGTISIRAKFVGTFQVDGGSLVFHVFDYGEMGIEKKAR